MGEVTTFWLAVGEIGGASRDDLDDNARLSTGGWPGLVRELAVGPSLDQLDGGIEAEDGITIDGVTLVIDSAERAVPLGGRRREDWASERDGEDGLVRDGEVVRLLRYEPAGDAARMDPLSADRGAGDSAR